MTTVRMLAAHEVVQRTFPRPPPEEADRIAIAVGRAIDGTLSSAGYDLRQGRSPGTGRLATLAASLLDDALAEQAVAMEAGDRDRTLARIAEVVRVYRRSEIAGLPRPKTRVFFVGEDVGVYAQPDFWDGRARFFEMKSYRAIPPPPDVLLQVRLFQLAFPRFESVLVCLDRHASPPELSRATVPPATAEEAATTLRLAARLAREFGVPKVREYLTGTATLYSSPTASQAA